MSSCNACVPWCSRISYVDLVKKFPLGMGSFPFGCLCPVDTSLAQQALPFAFFPCQAMAIINGSLYVFGGTTGYIYSTDLHKLDLNTREWTQLKPNNMHCDMPEER